MLTPEIIHSAAARSKPYKLFDGHGLHLFVSRTGAKSFRLKYRRHGLEQSLTFGQWPHVDLETARAAAQHARRSLAAGLDPASGDRLPPQVLPPFSELRAETGGLFVYFIKAQNGRIKIGVSNDPQKRLKALQTAHSDSLKLIGCMSAGYHHEIYLHRLFAEERLSGEWFNPSERLLAFIEENAAI